MAITAQMALLADGTVKSWGGNSFGQLGNGEVGGSNSTPATVKGLDSVVAIASGEEFSLALLADGTVKAWGKNISGQLGNGVSGENAGSAIPVTVTGLTQVTAIAAGRTHAMALLADGTVKAWGNNEYGELGIGTLGGNSISPVPVTVTGFGQRRVTAISTNDLHNLALMDDGTVMAWGYDWWGQLGRGGSGYRSIATPGMVTGLHQVKEIAAGGSFSLARLSDGTLKAWGANWNGELGNGNFAFAYTPTTVTGLGSVVAIKAGGSHSMALLADGTLKSWGWNENGQFGIDVAGGDNYSAIPLTIVVGQGASRAAPALTYAKNGTNVTASWSAVPGATGYTLLYADYPWMPWMTMDDIHGIDMWSQQGISVDLWPGAAFYIAVQARNPYGSSDYSNIQWFVLDGK